MGLLDQEDGYEPHTTVKGLLSEDAPRKKLLAQIGDVFVPELLSRRKTATKRLGPTAWLDGLRGIAALVVTMMHLTVFTHDGIELCYGAKFIHADAYNTTPAALPIIRLFFTGGHFAVTLFFVISGYVITRKLLQDLHEGRRQDFIDDLQSSMVRRPIRLFMPVILSTIAIFLSWHLLGIDSPSFPKKANLWLEFLSWLRETSMFLYFYKIGWLFTYYNVHSWTIPFELRGSMFIFTYLMMVHTVSTRSRILMTVSMMLHLACGSSGGWYATFFGGMLWSDLDLLAASDTPVALPWDRIDTWLRARPTARTVVLHLLFVASLYLATQPIAEHMPRADVLLSCPGWKTLGWLIPNAYFDADSIYRWYWLFWAAFIMVYCIREIGWLRGVCETQTAQYLGRHSFSLYLVHGPMITNFSVYFFYMTGVSQAWTDEQKAKYGGIQNMLSGASWWPLPSGGPAGLEPNFLFVVAISLPVFFYCAEVGTKAFDIPGIKASRWVWQKWKTL